MIITGMAVFFENAEDFTIHCEKDPFGRGYTYNRYPIKYPTCFPVAYKYEPDFDPRCIGSYIETPFDIAIYAALRGLESKIRDAKLQISQLNQLNSARKNST